MSDTNTGGPAFPVPAELCQDLTVFEQRGMTLRDYFAAKAMQMTFPLCGTKTTAAEECYRIADAMLKARE